MTPRTGRFASILNVDDMRNEARRRLPRAIFDYIDGAAEDEASRRMNRTQFEQWGFVPRVLNDVSGVDTSVTLFGVRYAAPFGLAPTGLAGLAWPNAEVLLAGAAAAASIPFCLSTVSSVRMEDVQDDIGDGHWFQLYIFRDRGLTRSLMERAQAAGYRVLCITLDCPTGGNRERDRRNNFVVPVQLTHRNALDMISHPGWLLRLALSGVPKPANMIESAPQTDTSAQGLVAFMSAQLDPSVTWADVAAIAAAWDGPVVLKGLLSVDDAKHAADLGVSGIVVSNHGGRQLNGAIPPLAALPAIRQALGPAFTILCDSGFRRGGDILKALALGANAVLMGRNALYGAGVGGAEGIAHVIALLKSELQRDMTLIGAARIADITRDHVRGLHSAAGSSAHIRAALIGSEHAA